MKQILLLEQETIDQIAAGEVVERPASVIKELVENAIDAGAGVITVEIRDGGISFIRITDNGEGIDPSQIRTAFLRHATSKIRSAEDLKEVRSLGFRGEALSSICAVSQMELITKTPGALIGSRYLIEGGQEKSFDEIGAPEGSTFLVKNLFYNTPARKKFLKSSVTETGYIASLLEHLSLSHPEISFKLIAGGQTKLYTSGSGRLKDVIYSLYGRQTANSLLEIHEEADGMQLTGFIGKPDLSRGNRSYENYFVNGRYIKSRILTNAIEEGYKGYMMQHRYPFTVLQMQITGPQVDVNVHPTKMEVRFAEGAPVSAFVEGAVRNALTHKELIPSVSLKSDRELRQDQAKERKDFLKTAEKTPEPFEKARRDFLARSDSPYQPKYPRQGSRELEKILSPVPSPANAGQTERSRATAVNPESQKTENTPAAPEMQTNSYVTGGSAPARTAETQAPYQMELFENTGLLSKENRPRHKLIGQLFDTYWLLEFKDELFIVDQHAAHEKVIYERLCRGMREKTFTTQQISPPMIISLTLAEEDLLHSYMELFTQVGFEIESFGGHDYAVTGVPDNLYGFKDLTLFTNMLDDLGRESSKPAADVLNAHLATMACKAAIKGGMKQSFQEADALIDELLQLENPYNCPHGRPTIIRMSRRELERRFRRIV